MSALYEQARAKAEELADALAGPHLQVEDCWYSCPASGECCNDDAGDTCNCGRDARNVRIAAALLDQFAATLELVEQEARRRAHSSRLASEKAAEASSTQVGFSAECYAYTSLADFCRSQRGTP